MNRQLHIRPLPGRLVRDPATRVAIDDTGAAVPDVPYWRRRIAGGDVQIVPADKVGKRSKKSDEGPTEAS